MYTIHIMATNTTDKKNVKNSSIENSAFSVIMTGGKQYIVHTNDVISVEKIDGEFKAGDTIVFDQVLMTDNGSTTSVGNPTVSGAKVTAEFIEEGRGKKLIVVKYKAKSRYLKKNGHRQPFMKFKITAIA
jgi:large subunit ribosomal protein L21